MAYEAVYQKFSKLESCRAELLRTENWVIAEATSNDRNWGIGLDKGDRRVHIPKQWQGTNMLDWALMEARKALLAPEALMAELPASECPHVSDEQALSKPVSQVPNVSGELAPFMLASEIPNVADELAPSKFSEKEKKFMKGGMR